MTAKKHYNPEGLRQYIEERASHTHGGHLIYTGPQSVQCNFKEMAVPRAYWLLTGHEIPDGKYLLSTCKQLNCIEPDHWAISHSPHTVSGSPVRPKLRKLRRALERAMRELEALEAGQETGDDNGE